MPNVAAQQIELLNKSKRRIGDIFTPTLFEATPPTPFAGNEYWHLSDLYNAGIYAQTDGFGRLTPLTYDLFYGPIAKTHLPIIQKADKSIISPYQLHQHHIATITHDYSLLNSRHFKRATDMELSRFACWQLANTNQSSKLPIVYFMIPNANMMELNKLTDNLTRMDLRAHITHHEKIINGMAQSVRANHQILHHRKQRAFFYYDIDLIRNHFKIPAHTPLTDYMTTPALHAYLTGLEQTIYQFNHIHTPYRTTDTLISIITCEMDNARSNLIKTGHSPEHCLTTQKIQAVESEYNKLQRNFIKQYGTTYIR